MKIEFPNNQKRFTSHRLERLFDDVWWKILDYHQEKLINKLFLITDVWEPEWDPNAGLLISKNPNAEEILIILHREVLKKCSDDEVREIFAYNLACIYLGYSFDLATLPDTDESEIMLADIFNLLYSWGFELPMMKAWRESFDEVPYGEWDKRGEDYLQSLHNKSMDSKKSK
jgi:hypothetical protein